MSGLGLAATVWALRILERRFQPSASLTRAGHLATGAGVVLLILVALVRFGSPITIAGDMYDRFNAPPPGGFKGTAAACRPGPQPAPVQPLGQRPRRTVADRVARLTSTTRCSELGAGTYESYYLQHRTNGLKVKNAHNLYLETLADLGPIGLLLLVAGLAAPLVAGVRAREEALVPVAFGGFTAYLLHAGADWDWQMAAVTLTALTCAVGMLTSTPSPRWSVSLTGRGVRAGILAAIALMAVLALVGLRGNVAAAASQRAASTHHWAAAESQARTAVSWEPWSADARVELGLALLGEGRTAEARAAFQAAIARDSRNWQAWLDLARASSGGARRGRSPTPSSSTRASPRCSPLH